MGWPESVATISFMFAVAVFFVGWPTLIIHTKCNCKKEKA